MGEYNNVRMIAELTARRHARQAVFGRARFPNADLRSADLRECIFGRSDMPTKFHEARFADCRVEGAEGSVAGPINVGMDSPRLLDGADLQSWFADHGAPLVEVWEPARP